MHDVELVSDGDGMAVVGLRKDVEGYLRSKGLWTESRELDLGRLSAFGAGALHTASKIAERSGQWVKLTKESARKVAEAGLIESQQRPGEKHLMIGKPGDIASWLQTDTDPGSLRANPDVLSGLGGLMAQVSAQQSMAEITAYLDRIDEKVDEVLQKVDDVVIAGMVGVGGVLADAMTARDITGVVDEVTWSKIDQAPHAIGTTQDFAVRRLEAITRRLESTRIAELAKASERAQSEARTWLAVLAYCFEKQEAVDILELDWRMARAPETLEAHRRLMLTSRDGRRERMAQHTEALLDRMDHAVAQANGSRLWHRDKSTVVVESGKRVAIEVEGFHEVLDIEADAPSWEVAALSRVADIGSRSIQRTKDTAPAAGAAAVAVATAVLAVKQLQSDESTND